MALPLFLLCPHLSPPKRIICIRKGCEIMNIASIGEHCVVRINRQFYLLLEIDFTFEAMNRKETIFILLTEQEASALTEASL